MNDEPSSLPLPEPDGEEPLIPRLYEIQAAEELLASAEPDTAARQRQDEALSDALAERDPEPVTEALAEGGLPFIGSVMAFAPGEAVTVRRTLSLDEDLYLADHAFVYAPGVKPDRACMPVLPMTMSLEVLAEVAACLVPGLGLIGFEDVTATRWIELAESGSLALNIDASLQRIDAERQTTRIRAAIRTPASSTPAITATVLFSSAYRAELGVGFTGFSNAYRLPLTGEGIYQERLMFHGPRFHCLSGPIVVAEQGVMAELRVRPPTNLFRSVRRPQLLIDPVLLDGIGQLIGVWAMQHERYVFPIGIGKLELYRPTPAAAGPVPVRIEISRDEAKFLRIDAEVQDGAGAVWMRIKGWNNWKFRWPRRLVDFRRQPTRFLLSGALALPSPAPGARGQMVSAADLAGFDALLLARHYLHMDEMADFAAKAEVPKRQLEWLLGRVAVKDAVRAWLAGGPDTGEMLHPAALRIDNDESGQPTVQPLPGRRQMPRISISHCEGRAVAVAADKPLGIDIETIRPRDAGFVDSICTAAERALLETVAGSEDSDSKAEWITRLWCAKEAAGKWLGTGVDAAPQRFEAIAIDARGEIDIQLPAMDRPIRVRSLRDGDFIVACATAVPMAAAGG